MSCFSVVPGDVYFSEAWASQGVFAQASLENRGGLFSSSAFIRASNSYCSASFRIVLDQR